MSIRSILDALTGRTARGAGDVRDVLRVVSVEVLDQRTALVCEGADGLTTVLVPLAPTSAQAERWQRLVRVHHVDITVSGPNTTATLHGIGHRMPTRRTIPVSVGLALLADGVAGNVFFPSGLTDGPRSRRIREDDR
jgi:hypothetical protein